MKNRRKLQNPCKIQLNTLYTQQQLDLGGNRKIKIIYDKRKNKIAEKQLRYFGHIRTYICPIPDETLTKVLIEMKIFEKQ